MIWSNFDLPYANTFEVIHTWKQNVTFQSIMLPDVFSSIVHARKYNRKNKGINENSFTITYIKILVILTCKTFQLLKTQDSWI